MDVGNEAIFPHPRFEVSVVGLLATWWMGIPIGIILGLVGLVIKDYRQMFRITMRAFGITIIIAFLTGIIGLFYGKLFLTEAGINWWLPENLIDIKNFIAVGSMHNFSYLGGLTGVIAGIIYIVRQNFKLHINSKDHPGDSIV